MQYVCLRECYAGRIISKGEVVGPGVAKSIPEHFAPCEAGKSTPAPARTAPPHQQPGQESPLPPATVMSDGVDLKGLRRWAIRHYAAKRFGHEVIAWGKTVDMIAAVRRLDQTQRAAETNRERRSHVG